MRHTGSRRVAPRSGHRWLAVLVGAMWATAAPAQEAEGDAPVAESQLEDLLESTSRPQQAVTHRYTDADLAPYFGSGELAEAKALFDRGRHARARARLRGEQPPVRYLRALSALQDDPTSAAQEFRALAGDYPRMRDHCLFHAARALERLRKRRAAADAYAQVSPGSTLYAEARLGQSRVLERGLDLDGALDALGPLRELPAIPRNDAVRRKALLAAARLCQRKGDYRCEHRAMLELWATSPLSREAKVVWERLKELPVPNRWRLRRAESFLAFNDNVEALRLARQVKTALPDEDACAASFVIGNALRKERQHRQAAAALAPMVEACKLSELRPQAMYVLGYSQSVSRQDAVRTYEALAREYPSHPFADDALFFAAELDLRSGNRAAALDRLEQVATRYATGNFAPEALFQLAWQHRTSGAHKEALAALDRLDRLPGLGRDQRLRSRYWRARALAEKGDASAATAFAALASDHPAEWYGLLARGCLPEGVVQVASFGVASGGAAPLWPLEAGPLGDDPRFLAGVELLRMQLPDAAAELLAIDRRGLPEDPARLLVEVLQRGGRTGAAAYVARTTLGATLAGGIDDRTVDVWRATYPLAFRNMVEQWARASSLDPDLLQALMREESRFNPSARSTTGALGLTQLMPRTAQDVARGLKLGRVNPRMLHRPALNIRLGAAYLAELLSEFEGSTVRAVAAYNAGPVAVWRWVRARPDEAIDEWVEEIPISETRDYVKRVLGSYGAYRLVYGRAAGPLALPVPPLASRERRSR
ncbi:transglycosylase SLT domain-containing protein [Anaeromyxobacter terrae]|uniref:transglycosylase SLT domain-containing protein n=1 Tax=Anaeromyxobacter terrae TaxID=2925406 RepID=UPI001F570A5A|nr:transglycosylase SLT domain-containing protein [Anaeromyxobacter sp. SG22]